MTWHKAALIDEVADNALTRVEVQGREILLVRSGGNIFATQLRCTHEDDDLSSGTLEDGRIVCGFHYATYDPQSGDVVAPPQDGGEASRLMTYGVRVEQGEVLVDI